MSNHLKKVAKEIAALEQMYQKAKEENNSNSKTVMMVVERKMTQLFEENVKSLEDMDELDSYILKEILVKNHKKIIKKEI